MAAAPRAIDRFAALVAHVFYRIDVVGRPPATGALLLLPNHPNALLDPALVMATAGRAVRFLAKSTLFEGPFRPLMRASDAIPVYRRQDVGDTGRNAETFAAVEAALIGGEAVCIFPEGTSHSSGRLEPLRTGAARIALGAAAAGADLRLVAVGINLERKTTFRSRATIAYGVPFGVSERRLPHAVPGETSPSPGIPVLSQRDGAARSLSPPDVKALTREIADHMQALIVEADPRADADLVSRVNRLYRSARDTPDAADADLARRRAIADAIRALRAERPEWYASAVIQLRRYDDRLRRFGVSDESLDWETSPQAAWRFVRRELPRAVLLVPVAAAGILIYAVPYGLTAAAARLTDDMDVTASAKVLAGAAIYSGWIAALTAAAWWSVGPGAALAAIVLLPLLAVGGLFAFEREEAAWQTARAWLALKGARHTTRRALRRRRAELAGVLEEISAWTASRADAPATDDIR